MIKPILFNTDMVRAILGNHKTVTRRVVKPRYCDSVFEMFRGELCEASPDKPPRDNGDGTTTRFVRTYVPCKAPYRPGDILYVQETFRIDYLSNIPGAGRVHYKADDTYRDFNFLPERYEMMRRAQLKPGWRPSIRMPREATRIFLRVTDVRVERLQDISDDACIAEGIQAWSKDEKLYKYYLADSEGDYPDCKWQECPRTPRDAMQKVWNSLLKPADRTLYGWEVNPWVWVIEFERISREKAGPLSKLRGCEHLSEIGVLARSGGRCKCPHWEWRGLKKGDGEGG